MWSVGRFYDVGRVGDPVPEGPVLVIANHPNSLMDALVIMKIAGRRVRPLAKAPLFQQAIIGHVLNGLGALPSGADPNQVPTVDEPLNLFAVTDKGEIVRLGRSVRPIYGALRATEGLCRSDCR